MTTFAPQPDNISDEDLELLSAYLDKQLAPDEHAQLEARLQREPALHAELQSLRYTTALLQQMPMLTPPRSFTFDPANPPTRQPRLLVWLDNVAGSTVLASQTSSLLTAFVLVLAGTTMLFAGINPAPLFTVVTDSADMVPADDAPETMISEEAPAEPPQEAAEEGMAAQDMPEAEDESAEAETFSDAAEPPQEAAEEGMAGQDMPEVEDESAEAEPLQETDEDSAAESDAATQLAPMPTAAPTSMVPLDSGAADDGTHLNGRTQPTMPALRGDERPQAEIPPMATSGSSSPGTQSSALEQQPPSASSSGIIAPLLIVLGVLLSALGGGLGVWAIWRNRER